MNTRSSLEMRALRYLSKREYSRLELEQKLSVHARSFPPEALSVVLDKLEQKGFLSAKRVIEHVIRTRRPRFGSQRIVYELKEKGIDEHLIHEALPALKKTELEAAFKIWQKKFDQSPSTREERARQMRFLMGRGFSSEIIHQVLSQADGESR